MKERQKEIKKIKRDRDKGEIADKENKGRWKGGEEERTHGEEEKERGCCILHALVLET